MAGLVNIVEGVEEFLLGGLLAGDELDIVHQKQIHVAVLLVGTRPWSLPYCHDELICKFRRPLCRRCWSWILPCIDDRWPAADGLAQTGSAVDKQRIVDAPGFSATATAAACANLLELPTMNRSKVYPAISGSISSRRSPRPCNRLSRPRPAPLISKEEENISDRAARMVSPKRETIMSRLKRRACAAPAWSR